MLIRAGKLRGEGDDVFLLSASAIFVRKVELVYPKCHWREEGIVLLPQRFEKLSEGVGKITLHP